MKTVQSVQRAISVLFVVTQSDRPLGLSEISRRISLDKATVLRLLATLEDSKLVQKDPVTKNYSGGANLSKLSNSWRNDIRQVCGPYLRALSEKVNETVCLICPRDMERICIESIPAKNQELTVVPTIGTANPIYAGASGKVLMAYMSPQEADRVIEQTGLKPVTNIGITDRKLLISHLESVRERGYDYSISDVTTGASALATPIFGADKQIVAALTVRGPEVRMSVAKMKQMAPWLIKTSDDISAELGFAGLDRAKTA
jgi:IclR family transcriptional regulator, KDG regulon repressor